MKNLLFVIFLTFGINIIYAQNIISIEAEGNLESPNPLLCVDLSEVTNNHNPADIYNGMKKCLEMKNFKNAARLFAIAGVVGDGLKIGDKTIDICKALASNRQM